MQVYLLTSGIDPGELSALESRIRATVPNLNRVETLELLRADRLRSPEEAKPYVIYPVHPSESFEQLINLAIQNYELFFIIFISDEDISASHYRRLLQTGGGDWVPAKNAAQEIPEIVRRMSAAPTGPERRQAAIATLLPSGGGVGNSTLAVEIGVQLKTNKATRERSVCLIDLDFQNSHVCDYLDIEPRMQIQEIADNPGRLDAQLFDIFLSHHSSGLDVLAAPRSKAIPLELNVAALDALFEMLSDKYQFVLVDLPAAWLSWTAPVLSVSGLIAVVGVNTIPSLRSARDTLEAVRALKPPGQITVAVNRCETGWFGGIAHRQHATSILRNEKIVFLREDADGARASANTGVPIGLSGHRSGLIKDIAQITSQVSALAPVAGEAAAPARPKAA